MHPTRITSRFVRGSVRRTTCLSYSSFRCFFVLVEAPDANSRTLDWILRDDCEGNGSNSVEPVRDETSINATAAVYRRNVIEPKSIF
mmetsp:Transcript_8247/g.10156  ORF Transcript_8247/g.10156 Transcript_8247/m.10156 type:complete len:87 (+) Transcript_8247:222-482(+)